MATQEKNSLCETVVLKLTTGKPLDEVEKTHLALCESCLLQLVKTLDETNKANSSGTATNGSNGTLTRERPEAKKALENGRRVFEREFGISLPKE